MSSCHNGNDGNFYQCLFVVFDPWVDQKTIDQLSVVALVGPLLGCFHNRCACFDRPLPIITPYTVGYISVLSSLYLKTYFASGCLVSCGQDSRTWNMARMFCKWLVLFFLVIPGHQFHAVFCVKSCDKREP